MKSGLKIGKNSLAERDWTMVMRFIHGGIFHIAKILSEYRIYL